MTTDQLKLTIGIVCLALAALILFWATAHGASAQNAPTYRSKDVSDDFWCRLHPSRDCFGDEANDREERQERRRVWRERERDRQRERRVSKVYVPYQRDYEPSHGHGHGTKCQGFLASVGDQYASEQGAKDEADKAWMQTARWQYGERYMDRTHADDATYECGRSSVGSVVGQVFYRCRLLAKPCRSDKKETTR